MLPPPVALREYEPFQSRTTVYLSHEYATMDENYQADGVDVWPKPPGRVRAARFGTSRRL